MTPTRTGEAAAIAALRRACEKAGGQNAWALQHGIDKGHLSRVAAGKRPMSDAVAAILGFERVTEFKRIKRFKR